MSSRFSRCIAIAALLALASIQAGAELVKSPQRGLLEVRSKTTKLYLFGTIHVGRSEFYPLPAAVERAFAQSKALVVEVKSDPSASAKPGPKAEYYEPPDTLEQHVPADLLAKVKALLPRYGARLDAVNTMRPWVLGITLTLRELGRHGFDSYMAVDLYLMDVASREGKPIEALESSQARTAIFQSFSPRQELALLESSVKQISEGRTQQLMADIVDAWGTGNAKACERAFAASYADLALADQINAKLIDQRNDHFYERIEEFLQGREQYFVAVGAAHLLGKKGIIARLKQRGYSVKQK
jgi:uncharacterized protein